MLKRYNDDKWREMTKLNFFDYWLVGEVGYSLILIFILPNQININFWLILTSKQTSGSVFNIIVLPILMAFPNLIQRVISSNSIYWMKQKYIMLILNCIVLYFTFSDNFLVANIVFWAVKKLLTKNLSVTHTCLKWQSFSEFSKFLFSNFFDLA